MGVCVALEGLMGSGEAREGVLNGEVGGKALAKGRQGCGVPVSRVNGLYRPEGVRGCEREKPMARGCSGEHWVQWPGWNATGGAWAIVAVSWQRCSVRGRPSGHWLRKIAS